MKELSKDDFEKEAGSGSVVIDFWAPWCGPCQVMGPHFEEASKENDKVKFFKVNVDDEPELASSNGVRSIPTVIFLKDGKEVDRTVGALNKDKINEKISSSLS